jgi:hypothetical protein
MANPNIVKVTVIKGENSSTLLSTTSAFAIANNPTDSNIVFKINTIIVANVEATSTAPNFPITLSVYDEDDLGGSSYDIVKALPIPFQTSVILIDKETSIYLKENQSIGAITDTANKLLITASWEEMFTPPEA